MSKTSRTLHTRLTDHAVRAILDVIDEPRLILKHDYDIRVFLIADSFRHSRNRLVYEVTDGEPGDRKHFYHFEDIAQALDLYREVYSAGSWSLFFDQNPDYPKS